MTRTEFEDEIQELHDEAFLISSTNTKKEQSNEPQA